VWFCSDEHTTFSAEEGHAFAVGDLVRAHPAHVDPTVALHEWIHVVEGDVVVDSYEVDLRGW
jgi:D-serine deaminase-like pyridoxal phosphate-dependent protein